MKLLLILMIMFSMPLFNLQGLFTAADNSCGAKLLAQDEEDVEDVEGEEHVPERLKYFKEKYEETYTTDFELVWAIVQETLDELGCAYMNPTYRITDEGYYKGVIKSDFCIISMGSDTTFDVMGEYSHTKPFIRGGIWENLRMQYKFVIKQISDTEIFLLMRTELSGFEDHVTHEYHFWKSNGILEKRILDTIREKIESQG